MDIGSEKDMEALGAEVGLKFVPGDVVLLSGELGAGKSTFVRGYLHSLGYEKPVKSPTFNLVQVFDTTPPVMHADLYRLETHRGLGIEEYLDSHVCFIEWPDRAVRLIDPKFCWTIKIEFAGEGRIVEVDEPVTRL